MIKCDSYTIRCGAYGFRVKPKEVKVFSVVLPFGTYQTWWRDNGILKSFLPKNTEITCVEESCKNDLFNQNPNEVICNYLIHFKTTEYGYASFIRKVLDWKNSFPYETEKPMLDFSEREYKIFRRTHPHLDWIKDKYGVPVKVGIVNLGIDDTTHITPKSAVELFGNSKVVTKYGPIRLATPEEVGAGTDIYPIWTPATENGAKEYMDNLSKSKKNNQSLVSKILEYYQLKTKGQNS